MQQVNLYTEEFRPRKDPLAIANLIGIVALVLVLAAAYSGYQQWSLAKDRQQVTQAEQRNAVLQSQVEQIQQQLDARAKDKSLEVQHRKLKMQLQNTRGLLDAIASGVNAEGNKISFANILIALGKHRLESVWLEHIRVLRSGERVVLEGQTTAPDALPRYLAALGQESSFAGRAFNEFVVETDPENQSNSRRFQVDTQAQEPPDKQAGATSLNSYEPDRTLSLRRDIVAQGRDGLRGAEG